MVAGFSQAQRIHDAQGPPEPRRCFRCDDTGKVEAIVYRDVDGGEWDWPATVPRPDIPCPECIEWRRPGG